MNDEERAALVARLKTNPIVNVQSGRDNLDAAAQIESDGRKLARLAEWSEMDYADKTWSKFRKILEGGDDE